MKAKPRFFNEFGTPYCKGSFFVVLFFLLVFLVAAPRSAYTGENLAIAGSGTNLAGIRILTKAFKKLHPDIPIDVPASLGSAGGIRAVAEGAVSIGLISRPLRTSEENMGLAIVSYAKTAVVIGVNADVPDTEISSRELLDIYKGKKTLWQNGHEIIVLLRDSADSTTDLLRARIPGFREIYDECQRTQRWITLYTDQDMNNTIVKTPSSVGLSDVGSITANHLPIKILKLNGFFPSPENVLNGRYPLVKTLSFVYVKSKVSRGAKIFMDFAQSKGGIRILRENGYLPPD